MREVLIVDEDMLKSQTVASKYTIGVYKGQSHRIVRLIQDGIYEYISPHGHIKKHIFVHGGNDTDPHKVNHQTMLPQLLELSQDIKDYEAFISLFNKEPEEQFLARRFPVENATRGDF